MMEGDGGCRTPSAGTQVTRPGAARLGLGTGSALPTPPGATGEHPNLRKLYLLRRPPSPRSGLSETWSLSLSEDLKESHCLAPPPTPLLLLLVTEPASPQRWPRQSVLRVHSPVGGAGKAPLSVARTLRPSHPG